MFDFSVKKEFVVHQHFAEKAGVHFDLRITARKEGQIVLISWASRKLDLADKKKVLLFRTEDHAYRWLNFSGEIPTGEYGAGKVKIWDRGTFTVITNTDKGMVLNFKGNKLKGRYAFYHMKNDQWLFFKVDEDKEK